MATYSWPKQGTSTLLGKHVDRVDGLEKATGTAKYAYDMNPAKMLMARALGSPHAHCKIKSIDVTPAIAVPGVVTVHLMKKVDNEIRWQGDLIAVVAAESEGAAAEGVKAIKVEYELLDVFVDEKDLAAAEKAGRTGSGGQNVQLVDEVDDDQVDAAFEKLFKQCESEGGAVVKAHYGIHVITHMCLEPHGSTCEWNDGKLLAHLSTQNVAGTGAQFADPLGITANEVTVHCDFMGGGFGSKFAADAWGVACAQIAKETGRPVKLMLSREQELQNAGNRPSGFIDVKIGADKKGVVKVWDSHHWGTSGSGGGGVSQAVIPYVLNPPNRRRKQTTVVTNMSPARAWRAPNHPQGCAITQVAYDDIAAKLGLDSYEVFKANLASIDAGKDPKKARLMAPVYEAEMEIAAKLMDWKAKWHKHGQGPAKGSVVSGLGMALHTWGGGGHNSTCNVTIHPDGGVESTLASQDIGTGIRTSIAVVVAETFGLPLSGVKVNIGSSKYPPSGPSGGSTTIGGISESNRRASQDALEKLSALVAKKLDVKAEDLEAKGGRIQTKDGKKGLSWKESCSLLGMTPLVVEGKFTRGAASPLSSSQVAGVQMAEVAVDKETGVVKMKKFVAVQDVGLIVNRQTTESQVYGAAIMGIAYALFEEQIMDAKTGAFVNSDLDNYKLPRLGDIGEIVVEMYEPASEYERGVVGIGEPPVISPGAAISNAVCNALGFRVPVLPMTPDRVLKAIAANKKA